MKLSVALTYQQADEDLRENFGLIVKTSKINGEISNDLFNLQLLNYYKAKEKYNKNRNTKFSTYLYTYLNSRRLNYIRDNSTDEVSLEKDFLEQLPSQTNIEKEYIQKEKSKSILKEINKLDNKGKFIVKQRIFNEKTFKEIANQLNCSPQNVNQIYKNRVKKIRKRVDD